MSHVQTAGSFSASGTTFVAGPAPGTVGTGNGVVGYGYVSVTSGTPAISTITDNATSPNSYTVADQTIFSGALYFQFYRVNIPGNPNTITINIALNGGVINTGFSLMYWEEFTDLSVGKSLDAHSFANVNTVTGTNGYKSASLPTQNVSELVFVNAMNTSGGATLTAGTVPAFTISVNDTGNLFWSEYRTQTATSAQGVWTATDATSSELMGVMTFGTLAAGGHGKGGMFLIGIGSIGWTPSLIGAAALFKVGKAIRRNATLSRRSLLIGK